MKGLRLTSITVKFVVFLTDGPNPLFQGGVSLGFIVYNGRIRSDSR